MKKLGVVAALALCVTVGGVYATWNYANKDVESASAIYKVSLAGLGTETQKGSLEVVGSAHNLKIDDGGNYKATLTCDPSGKFTVTFTAKTAADGVSADVIANGIHLKWYVDCVVNSSVTDQNGDGKVDYNDLQYQGVPIYSIDSEAEIIDRSTAVKSGNTFTYEIPVSEVMAKITLGDFTLDERSEYDAFEDVLELCTFHVHVAESSVGASNP